MKTTYKHWFPPYIVIVIGLFAHINYCLSQSIDELKKKAMNTNQLTLVHGDSVETFFLNTNFHKDKKYLKDSFYSWYRANKVKQTQGSAAGRLLVGEYSLFNRDLSLVQRGNYEEGQRKGIWRQWYPKGSLKRQEIWKKGILTGSFTEYYSDGKLLKKGKYKNNTLHGLIKEYSQDGIVIKKRYKNGEQKMPKAKKKNKKAQANESIIRSVSDRITNQVELKKLKTKKNNVNHVNNKQDKTSRKKVFFK